MNVNDALVLATLVLDGGLLSVAFLRSRRPAVLLPYAALAAALLAMGASYLAAQALSLGAQGEVLTLWSFALAHVLIPFFVFSFFGGEGYALRRPVVLGLALPLPVLLTLDTGGAPLGIGYPASLLSVYLIACLAVAFGKSLHALLTSPLWRPEAFWLVIGTFLFLDMGPIYANTIGAARPLVPLMLSLAGPAMLATFAIALTHVNPFPGARPPSPMRASSSRSLLGPGALVVEETRPKYLELAARGEASNGRAVLVLERQGDVAAPFGATMARVEIEPTRRAALRTLATASVFLASQPAGVVVLKDLAAIAALSGWPAAVELNAELRRLARLHRSTLLLATHHLSRWEREYLDLEASRHLALADPAKEIEAILDEHQGQAGRHLLAAFLREQGLAREALNLDHVPLICAFLRGSFRELAVATVDLKAALGLRSSMGAVSRALTEFWERRMEELATGTWAAQAVARPRDGPPRMRKARRRIRSRRYPTEAGHAPSAGTPQPGTIQLR